MSNINNISSHTPIQSTDRLEARGRQTTARQVDATPAKSAGADEVDFSSAAKRLNALTRNEGTVRPELVERIKGEIANGGYLNDAKLDAAADALLDRLELEG